MRSAERNISDYKVIKERQYDVGAVQMRVAGILHRAVFFMKGDCSIVRAPVIAASKHALLMSAVRNFHNKRTCLLTQTSPFMKARCSVLCTPASAASIRNPGCRPPYSYRLARPISMTLRVQARSGSWLLSGTFIVN